MIRPDRVNISRDYTPVWKDELIPNIPNDFWWNTNLLKASVVVDFKLAVLASLEFLEVDGAVPRIALTSSESSPSLSPDLLKSSDYIQLTISKTTELYTCKRHRVWTNQVQVLSARRD